jgi:hypothetical protein
MSLTDDELLRLIGAMIQDLAHSISVPGLEAISKAEIDSALVRLRELNGQRANP